MSDNNYGSYGQQTYQQPPGQPQGQPLGQPVGSPLGQPQWQPGMPPPNLPKQKKPFFKRTWVIVSGAIIAVFVIVGIANGGSTPANNAADTPSGGQTSNSQPADEKKSTQPSQKPAAQAPAKKWVKLITLSGSADKSSDTIKTTGGKLRVSYNFTDPTKTGMIVVAVYVLDEGVDPQKDGAIPDVMISEPGKDATTIRKDAGEYYVRVSAANTKYTVTVEEER